ncbi:glutamate receptor-like [Palaemon carinicauda]|uniref:glutamate receptor-like n=1 Tax=Palaemon carinicauda TaxID=392227 RepID=UPI0035B64BC6
MASIVEDFRSVVILYDDSHEANIIFQMFLQVTLVSTEAGQMEELLKEPDLLESFLLHHDAKRAITLLLFEDVDSMGRFLEVGLSRGLSTPIVLISLREDLRARELLSQMSITQHVTLLTPNFMPRRVKYLVTTFTPHKTSKLISQEFDFSDTMKSSMFTADHSPNFHGRNFQLASWIDDFPYLFYNNDKEVDGIGITMLREIAERVNFTFSLQEIPPDGYWGELINGTWVGMLGQVVREEKDFIINGFAVVLDRYQAADFTIPYFTDSYSITLKVPPPFPRWLSVVQPFSRWVWAAVLLSLLALAIIFHLLIRNDHSFVYNEKYDIVSSLVWLSRNLLRQSAPYIPSGLGCRAFLCCWWIAALVLSTSYMGNLIAFLTVPSQTRRIATLEELAMSKVKIHMLDYGNFVPGFLWSSKEPILRKLGDKLSLLPDYDQIIAAFEKGAGVLEASAYSQFLFITQKRIKTSYAVEEKLFPNYVAWAFQKGSPYKSLFDRYLERMTHSGLVEYWHRSVVDKFQRSTGQVVASDFSGEKINLQALTLDNLQGAFIAMGLGTVLSIFVLLFEILTIQGSVK